jgi:tripartite-type tricarboxylate transporter receptor subunit TctC
MRHRGGIRRTRARRRHRWGHPLRHAAACERSTKLASSPSRSQIAEDTMKPLAVALALCGIVCIGAPAAPAADWPTRPIRIIAPAAAGGAADMFARLLCDHFGETFRERCFVENRAGAGGLIGTVATAQAAPDGHTLTTSSIAYHVIAPVVSANPGFDPLRDFTHIAYIGGPPNVFVVNPTLGVRSLAELVALGRRGQAIDYVSPGVGTHGHLLAEFFARKAGVKLQQIMTKSASQALMDLVAGNVNVGTMTWTTALGQIRAGKVIPLAVTSRARPAEFPELPTFKDLGYDELTAVTWFALSGPAGLPSDITLKLNQAVAAMLHHPEVRKRLERDAVETEVMSPAEFTAFVAREIDKWAPVARQVAPAK